MSKKFIIGALAVLGLLAVSQTPAAAATCLSWKTIAGSSMCVAWATKGVQVLVTFRDGCFFDRPTGGDLSTLSTTGGGGTVAVEGCRVTVTASGSDSIAFCGDPVRPTRVPCNQQFTFGPTDLGFGTANNTCVEHEDHESAQGEAHEKHHCVTAATLNPAGAVAAGTACCAAANAGTFRDLTPIEMETNLVAGYFGGGSEVPPCTPGSFGCNVEQTCSINPKKIQFITDPAQGKEYQCNVDCVGDACAPPPPPPCDGECIP